MSFEFVYCAEWYKYEDGRLMKRNSLGKYFDTVCPVVIELQNQMEAIPEDVRPIVMQGLLHAYCYGIIDGKKKKIAEFKSLFNID
jgi:hypothetical protein